MKSYTDLEQSKKLAEILPIESADMRYAPFGDTHPWFLDNNLLEKGAIPCWSLAALLDILNIKAYSIDEDAIVTLSSYKTFEWDLSISNSGLVVVTESDPIDACVKMIYKLKEKDLI